MPTDIGYDPINMQRIGVIDIGSNSVRLVIYEHFGSSFTPIYNEKVLAGLGRDLQKTGKLNPESAERAFMTLRRFKYIVDAQNLPKVIIAATAALRDAIDAPAFIKRVHETIGFEIHPLSGAREAYFGSLGVLSGDIRATGIVGDLGGGSLELTPIADKRASEGATYPLGPFSMYVGPFEAENVSLKLDAALVGIDTDRLRQGETLYLVGGAWRNLGIIHQERTNYPLRIAGNYEMDASDAKRFGDWACTDGSAALLKWPGISTRRAETLPYAGMLMAALIEKLKTSKVVVAPGGLRDGLVFDAFPTKIRERNSLYDACRDLARGRTQGVNIGQPLIEFLSDINAHLPMVFEAENEERLRRAACYLVGLGRGLHPDHRAAIAFEMVLFAPLPTMTHKERAYLALMLYCSYTSKASVPNAHIIDNFLTQEEQRAAGIYGEAMRFGVVLSGRSGDVLNRQKLALNGDTLELKVSSDFDGLIVERCWMRLNRFAKLAGFKMPENKR